MKKQQSKSKKLVAINMETEKFSNTVSCEKSNTQLWQESSTSFNNKKLYEKSHSNSNQDLSQSQKNIKKPMIKKPDGTSTSTTRKKYQLSLRYNSLDDFNEAQNNSHQMRIFKPK